MAGKTQQEKFWRSKFGKQYTERNTFNELELNSFYIKNWGISRDDMNIMFLQNLSKDISILEVGCNNGQQLRHLNFMGFHNLNGIDVQEEVIKKAKNININFNFLISSALHLPFSNSSFDLIFTSGLLIHIAPENLIQVASEIYRCARKYIWGFEYYSEDVQEISYRGNDHVLWKRDFLKYFLNHFAGLKILKSKKFEYLSNDNSDQMFLLEK